MGLFITSAVSAQIMPPSVVNVLPAEESYIPAGPVTFRCDVSKGSGYIWDDIWMTMLVIDGEVNSTNSSPEDGPKSWVLVMGPGRYYYYCIVIDYSGYVVSSTEWGFDVYTPEVGCHWDGEGCSGQCEVGVCTEVDDEICECVY